MTGDNSDDESIGAVEEEHDGRSSFQQWFENDRNVAPTKRIQYLMMMMMMMGIDPMFSLDVPPFSEGRKLGLKPTLELYKKEVRRRDPKAKVSRNIPELAIVLRDELPLTDPADIEFVKEKVEYHKEKLSRLADEKAVKAKATGTRTTFRSLERMRFVECMVLDRVKPLYLRAHEVMDRQELDGRNSDQAPADFYDAVTEEFNNESFIPMSRCLPHLHDRLSEATELPLEEGVLMTREYAQKLLQKMKGPLAKLVTNYERSGNGDGMRGDVDDREEDPEAGVGAGFDATNCIEGSNIGLFLQQNDPYDLLYWWHVLQDADMLDYTISILSDAVGATSDGTPSVLTTRSATSSSEKQKNNEVAHQISLLFTKWEEDNMLKRQAHSFHRDRMKFDQEAFSQKMQLEHGRDDFDRAIKKRDLEREVEGFEDELDAIVDGQNVSRKKRLEERIVKLKKTIENLDKK
jgi:hypothetical protein